MNSLFEIFSHLSPKATGLAIVALVILIWCVFNRIVRVIRWMRGSEIREEDVTVEKRPRRRIPLS